MMVVDVMGLDLERYEKRCAMTRVEEEIVLFVFQRNCLLACLFYTL